MLFRLKIKRVATLVLGRNSQNASRRKLFSIGWPGLIINSYKFLLKSAKFYGWRFLYLSRVILRGKRFIFGIVALIFIFTGTTPFDLYKKTIRALTGKTEIINLYAGNCAALEQPKDFKSGWWNDNKAVGAPDLGPDAGQLDFSDENSAFYSGGDYSLVCGDFMFLAEEENQPPAPKTEERATGSENYLEIEPSLPKAETDNSGVSADEESETKIDEATSAPDKLFAETATGTEETDAGEAAGGQAVKAEVIDTPAGEASSSEGSAAQVEIKPNSDEAGGVEIIDKPQAPAEVPEIISPQADSPADGGDSSAKDSAGAEDTDEGPVSILQKVKQFFSQPSARAQEFLAGKTKSLEDLGKFKSAKIKFSLALINKLEKKQETEPDNSAKEKNKADISAPADTETSLPVKENGDLEQTGTATGTLDAAVDAKAETPEQETGEAVSGEAPDDGNGPSADSAAAEKTPAEDNSFGTNSEIQNSETGDESGVDTNGQTVEIKEDNKDADSQAVEIIDGGDSPAQVEIKDEQKSLPESESKDGEDLSLINKFMRAANAQTGEAKLIVWYSLENDIASSGPETGATNTANRLWQKLDTISGDNLSNALNGGYLSYGLDFIKSWQDIKNLKIKIAGQVNTDSAFIAYLDSVWVEAEYEPESELDKLKKRQRWEDALDFLSQKTVFQAGENGEMTFRYNKNEERLWDTLGEILGLANFWKNVTIEASLVDSRGKTADLPLTLIFEEDGQFTVKLPDNMRALKPGEYSIKFHIEDNSGDEPEIFDLEQKFSWGIMAMNFNRSIYTIKEKGFVQMAVLDNLGHTICDADLELDIKDNQSGKVTVLSSRDGTIARNSECGPETVTDKPDYYAYYDFAAAGKYEFTLIMNTAEGQKAITETIKAVGEEMPFTIERAGPTRIYPKADYGMKVLITAREDFKGDITETVPAGFKIANYKLQITNSGERDPFGNNYKYYTEDDGLGGKKLVWQDVEILAGDALEIDYTFDAPDESPEFYLLGPLEIKSQIPNSKSQINSKFKIQNSKFIEQRQWQVASDAVNKRARTVMFLGGTYSGGATSGQSTNVDNTFSSFNFRLAETGVDIKNAFIIFESQFEAYNSTGGDYTGYKLYFDTCEETCTANALSGTGRVLDDNSNILAYDEAESNQVRLLFDVTNEAQLAAYTGGGADMEAQIAYQIKNGTTKTSIANAKATLVLTYTYDAESENLTNTVIYPLDSADTTPNPDDSGSKQAELQGDCTKDSDCPLFDYKMEIPEWPGIGTSTNRVSQWFTTYMVSDLHGSSDVDITVNIEGTDTDSNNFHHECANGSTQTNEPAMIFGSVAGFAENNSQQLEFVPVSPATNNDYDSIGGEVFETYIASSSASTKTRTVSFPIGIVNNGQTTAQTLASTDVYFGENGSATGTVKIKKAWLRIISNNYNSGSYDTNVTTKIGNNATSSVYNYKYDAGASVPKPSFNIIHIIPPADYAALEEANAQNSVKVALSTQNDSTVTGGLSAELMITYTYSNESDGYLTSLQLFAGQTATDPATTTTATTAPVVLPEGAGKTIRGASLLMSALNSDSLGDVGAGTVFRLDADLSTSNPSCSPAFISEPDDINSFVEFYKDVSSGMNTTDGQVYNICLADDEPLSSSDGAKMNGILSYTYEWDNSPPTGAFIIASTTQKTDGSGIIDIGIEVDDPDDQDARAKLEYAAGADCDFSSSGDPTIDETDANITADFGDPDADNSLSYQIGTPSAYIKTASGTNSVYFDWLASGDLGEVEGDYCLRLTANDIRLDQTAPATTTVYIDTLPPTSPGALSLAARTGATTTLYFGATSTESNFSEYKIFYKIYDGADPTEADSVWASSSDANLGDILFNGAATTSIGGLNAKTIYSFAIWAYDAYGNRASSSRVDIETNDAPSGSFNSAGQKTDGSGTVDISIEVDDLNNDDTNIAKIEYATGTDCDFSSSGDPGLDENSANISADFGSPVIDNSETYQVGSSSGYILTSPGANTVDFDWLADNDLPAADGIYCLRLTVNDGLDNQLIPATTTVTLDNINPAPTGSLSAGAVTTDSITLIFATSSPASDTNEPTVDAYKIFYKKGTSGVTESDTEYDDSALNAYNYNSATSTLVSGLDSNSWYVFNIWAYDAYGNKASSSEVAIKTNATISNDSLTFVNPESAGTSTNIAVASGTSEWIFRAVVSETNGWYAIASTTLRLADNSDSSSPFNDLAFSWDQTANSFSEIGADTLGAAVLSGNSTSTCALNTCTLDFKIIFNKNFTLPGTEYTAELYSGNDSAVIDHDSYDNFYQIRYPYVEQIHYRWRNDDGGE